MAILQTAQKWRTWHLCFHRLAVMLLFLSQISSNRTSSPLSCWTHDIPSKLSQYHPRWQSSWGQHGAHLGPVGPMLAPWTLLSGMPIYGLAQFVARSSGKKWQGWCEFSTFLAFWWMWIHYSLRCFIVNEWYGMQIHIFAPLKQFRASKVELRWIEPNSFSTTASISAQPRWLY